MAAVQNDFGEPGVASLKTLDKAQTKLSINYMS